MVKKEHVQLVVRKKYKAEDSHIQKPEHIEDGNALIAELGRNLSIEKKIYQKFS